MPRTRSKRMRRRRSRHIRHRARRTRVGRKKRSRRRVSRRQMRGGKLFGKPKQLREIPPSKHQKDDWSLGVFGDSKDKTEGDTKPKITYTANKPDSDKPRRGTKDPNAPNPKKLPDPTKLFGNQEQDIKGHDKTDKELNKRLSGLRKMVGQTSTSQSSTYGMTCVEPIPNSPGSYKVLDKDGIRKHLI